MRVTDGLLIVRAVVRVEVVLVWEGATDPLLNGWAERKLDDALVARDGNGGRPDGRHEVDRPGRLGSVGGWRCVDVAVNFRDVGTVLASVLVVVRLQEAFFCWSFREEIRVCEALVDSFTSVFVSTKKSSLSKGSLNFSYHGHEVNTPIDGRESTSGTPSNSTLENKGTLGGVSSRGNERIRAMSVLPTSR